MGDKKVSIKTTVLEEKATACSMICCYADELKEGFYPYVADVSLASPLFHLNLAFSKHFAQFLILDL